MQCSEVSVEVASGLGFDSGWDSMLAWQRWSKSCGRHFSHLSWVSQDDNITCLQLSLKVRDSAERHPCVLRAICVWPRQRQQWLRLKRSTNRANTNKEGHGKKALYELLRLKTSQRTEVTFRMDCFTELLVQLSKLALLSMRQGKGQAPVNNGSNSWLNSGFRSTLLFCTSLLIIFWVSFVLSSPVNAFPALKFFFH